MSDFQLYKYPDADRLLIVPPDKIELGRKVVDLARAKGCPLGLLAIDTDFLFFAKFVYARSSNKAVVGVCGDSEGRFASAVKKAAGEHEVRNLSEGPKGPMSPEDLAWFMCSDAVQDMTVVRE